tara:strand:+ start:104 stop:493 length:390 start_codon:yes stop_codon:yes gene_type:complete
MKLNRKTLRRLIKQQIKIISESDQSSSSTCPRATQDQLENEKNKSQATNNPEIQYGDPNKISRLEALKESGRLCGNCSAFNVSKKMIACKGATRDQKQGYCEMYRFTCKAEKTCLSHSKGGPNKEWNSE